jgi:hypothetical protein
LGYGRASISHDGYVEVWRPTANDTESIGEAFRRIAFEATARQP